MAKSKYHRRADGLLETTRTDPRTGKRIHFYGHTDRDIDRQIMEYSERTAHGRTFGEVAEEWENAHFPTLAANTLKSYRPAYKRAVEHFKDEYIRQIRPQDVKSFINSFARTGRAKKTVTTQLLILSLICSYAVENGDLDVSPCDHISIPKNLPQSRRDAASPEDEKRVKANVKVWLLPYLVLYTGLRRGEALALTRDDFDFDTATITISKSIYYGDTTEPKIKQPKTAAGIRTVPILDPLLKVMPRHWKGYLFSEDGGETPLTEYQYQVRWENFVQQTGVTSTAHQLRHSYATMLFECGVEVKDAQDLLGHSTAAMTQDIYTHLRNKRKEETAKKLNETLKKLEAK